MRLHARVPGPGRRQIVLNKSIAGIKLGEAKSTVPPALALRPRPPSQRRHPQQTQWVYYGRVLVVGFNNGHVVQVFTENRKPEDHQRRRRRLLGATVKAHIKGVTCTHVKGFSGQECVTSVRHGSMYMATDFHVGPKGHVTSVLVNIFSAGGAVDRAMGARLTGSS